MRPCWWPATSRPTRLPDDALGLADFATGLLGAWERVGHDAGGDPQGLLVESEYAQRSDLTAGLLTGAALVGDTPAPANAWERFYTLTPAGTGEASLQLATASVTSSCILVGWQIKAGTGRYAQVGARAGSAGAWANIDLNTGAITARGARA